MNNDDINFTERDSFAASASQLRPHLAAQIDELAHNPGMRAWQVKRTEPLTLSDRRFLINFVQLLNRI